MRREEVLSVVLRKSVYKCRKEGRDYAVASETGQEIRTVQVERDRAEEFENSDRWY